MSPIDEAKDDVSRMMKNVIRVEIINRFQEKNIGLEEIDEALESEAQEAFLRIMAAIEDSYLSVLAANPSEDGHKHAHFYYVACTMALAGYMLGFNAMR